MKIKVGVFFGGVSVEHEISVISAVQAMKHIDTNKYEVVPVYIDKDRNMYTGKILEDIEIYKEMDLLKRNTKKVTIVSKDGMFYLQSLGLFKNIVNTIDVAFPIVHGANVEDGSLAGYFKTLGIPFVGSSVLGSALGQDKVVMKQVFKEEGLPIVDYVWFYDYEYLNDSEVITDKIKKLGYPVIVKPASLGSSVGITVVKEEKDLNEAIMDAINYDKKIVVEAMVKNMVEVNASVLGNYEYQEVSAIEEVMGADEFLSFNDKYIGNAKGSKSKGMASTNRIIPARISDELKGEVEETAKKAFKVLNLTGVCRVDFLIDKEKNKVYINEPNTIPGSLSFYLWEPIGKKYSVLLDEMITIAIKEYRANNKKTQSFESNVLSNFNGTKGVKGIKTKLN